MIKTNIEFPALIEIETDFFRTLQQTYSDAFTQLLTELDLIIAAYRDKVTLSIEGQT